MQPFNIQVNEPASPEQKDDNEETLDMDTIAGLTSFAVKTFANANSGQDAPPKKVGLSFRQAVTAMVINCVGAGVVLLPKVMADVGMLTAPLLCVICASACLECGIMICTGCKIAEQMHSAPVCSYEALATIVGGPFWKKVLVVTKNFAFMGFLIAYMQFTVDNLASLIPLEGVWKLMLIRFAVVFPVFTGLAMVTNLNQLARFSSVGIAAVIVECMCIMVGGVWLMPSLADCPLRGRFAAAAPPGASLPQCPHYSLMPDGPPADWPGRLGVCTAIFLFSFAVLATVPSMRSQLADPSQMHSVLSVSFRIIGAIYCAVMLLGYLALGSGTPDNIITYMAAASPRLGVVASVAMIVNILVSTPLLTFCVISVFEASGHRSVHKSLTLPNQAARCMFILVLNVVGCLLPYVLEVIGLVSSVFSCGNNIFFPCLFHVLSRRTINVSPAYPRWRRVKYSGTLVIGMCVLIFGVQGSLQKLIAKLKSE